MADSVVYRIHPAIGIARLGNSKKEFFLGPEVVDQDFRPTVMVNGKLDRHYRDAEGNIRRQAALFHVYEYTYPNELARDAGLPSKVREITHSESTKIRWRVTVANLKSGEALADGTTKKAPNEPGEVKLSGTSQSSVQAKGVVFGVTVVLGEFSTDELGRLRALAGFGEAGPLGGNLSSLQNANWYDDVADGPVRATIEIGGVEIPVEPAWLVTGSPRYAQPVEPIVSLYDIAYQVAMEQKWLSPPALSSFLRDVYPILHTAVMTRWVSSLNMAAVERGYHNFEDPARFQLLRSPSRIGSPERAAQEKIFNRLKQRGASSVAPDMPQQQNLSLTEAQYKLMHRWSSGLFYSDWPDPPPTPPVFEKLKPLEQARSLDQAHMRSVAGGSFFPGIEVGDLVESGLAWSAPFRFKDSVKPGAFTSQLAVPWQADFEECGAGWWPASRPDFVLPEGSTAAKFADFREWTDFSKATMVENWKELGFLVKSEDGRGFYVETERQCPHPTSLFTPTPTSAPGLINPFP